MMMLVASEQAPTAKPKVSLTRTTRDTLTWAARAALGRMRIERRRPSVGASKAKLNLTRTHRDTFQWMMRATPWGAASITGALILAALALAGLWMLVPFIDQAVADLTAIAHRAFEWVLHQIDRFPTWLASLLPGSEEPPR